jgi:phosphoadenosine phosphosulfate reductase
LSAIALYAKASPEYAGRVGHAIAVLQSAAAEHGVHIVQATSLGAEDMVITDLIARHHLDIAIQTLDTGKLHAETLALIARIEQEYGVKVDRFTPVNQSVLEFVRLRGEDAMFKSIELRKACCALRKLEPLARMLAGRSAWITGLRREQSDGRASVIFSERDSQGRFKINPLADWSWAEVWHYVASHNVPYNPLHDQFMPSIGCAPCTRAIAVGEEFRSGRWWWEVDAAKECGLHGATA